MANNPDHFTTGTRVRLSEEGKRNEIARSGAEGVVTSKYPIAQCVTVKWDYKKSKDRLHIELLEPVKG